MKLLNFSLDNPVEAISLIGKRREWDLHNFGTFMGFDYRVDCNTLTLKWTFPTDEKDSVCALIFRDLKYLCVLPASGEIPLSEGACVSGIFAVTPQTDGQPSFYEYRVRSAWENDESFNLVFLLFTGESIEVGAEIVELVEGNEESSCT